MGRLLRFAAALVVVAAAGACSSPRHPSRAATLQAQPAPRLSLDPELSPVPFRWLAADAVLVEPKVGERKLASFGNYVRRAAQQLEHARLSVWDDEAAWKLAGTQIDGEQALAHRRADYVKESSLPEPADRYLVFRSNGELVYQRDFRSWPLTDLD